MKTRILGNSGIEVSELGFGCMGLNFGYGPAIERQAEIKLLKSAVVEAITFFDTAECYHPLNNEELVGESLEPYRKNLIIVIKFGFQDGNSKKDLDSSPKRIREVAEASLKKLRTDVIDLFYQHRVDSKVPVEDVVGTVKELIKEGKVRHFGMSEAGVKSIRKAHVVQGDRYPLSLRNRVNK